MIAADKTTPEKTAPETEVVVIEDDEKQQDGEKKGKGKGKRNKAPSGHDAAVRAAKAKAKDLMQQYNDTAWQQAYFSAYAQYWDSATANYSGGSQNPGEECTLPGSYVGVLKHKLRYGRKISCLVCDETRQYLDCDVNIEKADIPEGVKDGDKVQFTVATMYRPWTWDDQTQSYLQLPVKGYPKAKTATKAAAES